MGLAERIRSARKERRLSQEAAAHVTGMSVRAYRSLETGESADPHYTTLLGISRGLSVPITDLLGESELAGKAQAPPDTAEGEERRALYTLIRSWANWARSFHGSFVVLFVNGLPENPDADVVRVNIARLDVFATEFFNMEEGQEKSGAYELVRPYWEDDELLELAPEDVAQDMQDIRDAEDDIRQHLKKAVAWVRRNAVVGDLSYDLSYIEPRVQERAEWMGS